MSKDKVTDATWCAAIAFVALAVATVSIALSVAHGALVSKLFGFVLAIGGIAFGVGFVMRAVRLLGDGITERWRQ